MTAGTAAAPAVDAGHEFFAPAAKPSRLSRLPFAALFLTTLLVAIFIAEMSHERGAGQMMDMSRRTLVAMGGLDGNLVLVHHQWWRLFTAPLLHGNLAHITGNAAVLLLVGWLLEPLIGTAWFGALFAIGALGGSLASLFLNPADVITVGASGAIMALLSATFVCSFHDEAFGVARRMRVLSVRLIIPSLLPSLSGAASHIDYSAHTGGAMAGVAMGFALMILWREDEPRPGSKPFALVVAGIGLALATVAFTIAARTMTVIADAPAQSVLIPPRDMPHNTDDAIASSADLVTHYPKDPRAHLYRAMHFLRISDIADARDQLRTGLAAVDPVRDELSDTTEPALRIMLALTLAAQGQVPEAGRIAEPACAVAKGDSSFSVPLHQLQGFGVCN